MSAATTTAPTNRPLGSTDDQHYIPKLYLKGFADRKQRLYVYEKEKSFRESKPKDEAHRPEYYTHLEDGKRDTTAEDNLKVIESRVAPILRKLANSQFEPTQEQWGELYFFVSVMFARTPSWREQVDRLAVDASKEAYAKFATDKEKFYEVCRAVEASTGKKCDWESLRQEVLSKKIDLVQSSVAFNLGEMFRTAFTVMEELIYFGCLRQYAPTDSFFFTSDSPVVTLRRSDDGFATVGVGWKMADEVVFPANKRVCLIFQRAKKEMRLAHVTDDIVANINKLIMATASRDLYGPLGTRRNARLFDQDGCKVQYGKTAFLSFNQLQEVQRRMGKESWIL